MINCLLVYVSIDPGDLRRFMLLLTRPKSSRWVEILILAVGISSLSRGQCFQPAPNVPNAGFNNPRSVAVGNFNGDNQLDMVVANAGSNTISLLLGNGQSGLSTANTFPVGSFPNSIIVDDFNNDSKSDLAVSNGGSSNISVLLGNGQGGFGATINYGTGSAANSMTVGDFNGDSRPDLVTVSSQSNTVSVLLGNGQGGFGTATSFNAGEASADIAVGDFNSDGWLDLVVPNNISTDEPVGYISVLIGNGKGEFGEATRYTATGRNASKVAVGDFNNDGRSDLVVTNRGYGQRGVTVFLDNGQSGFGFTRTHFIYLESPGPVALGDFNNDNKLDLAVTNYDSFGDSGPYFVSVSLGDGQGGFGKSINFSIESQAEDITVGDFNGDNRFDMATAGSTNNVSILLNCTNTGTSQPGLTGLSLINADNGEVISRLANDQVVNLSTLSTQNLSIRAEASQSTASVVFALSGPLSHTQIESFLPYALFGDTESGKYNGWTPPPGQYSLQVTPYDQAGGTGSAGQPLSINFTVIKPPLVTSLSLIDADNNQVLFSLTDNRQIDLSTLPTQNLSIRAEASQSTASVVFALSGPLSHTQIESFLPYALFGDTESGKYNGWTPPPGQYSLQVTPYDQAGGTGSAGQPLSINFTVIKPPLVTSLSLIDADNNQVIGPLTDGQVINLSSLSKRNLSIRANTQPSPTGSVVFNLSGPQSHTQTESELPYALFGNNNSGADNGWTPLVGVYSLRVIPYTQARAEGAIGTALYINFTVVDQATARVGAWGIDEQHLVVEMLGNPISTEQAEVVVRGAAGKPLQLVLMDEQGRQLHRQRVEKAGVVEHQRVPLGRRTGLYLLRVTTPTESKTVRVLQVK